MAMRPPVMSTRGTWPASCGTDGGTYRGGPGGADPLPDAAALEGFFEACYQASMLREEERPVVFRAVLAEPALFEPEGRLSGEVWAPLESTLPLRIAERMMRRVIQHAS